MLLRNIDMCVKEREENIVFKDIDISAKEKLQTYFDMVNYEACEYCFATLYMWQHLYKTGTGDQNFVIYSYPYTDKDTFTKEYFVHKRDSVMKINIPGAREGCIWKPIH